jgi:hypothetical protein
MRLAIALTIFFAVAVVLPILIIRALIRHFRDRDQRRSGGISGAVGGMMMDLDRLIRPTTQHVREVNEMAKAKRDDRTGGE